MSTHFIKCYAAKITTLIKFIAMHAVYAQSFLVHFLCPPMNLALTPR